MSKKSNKTSHVLNLLTNRTGLSVEELEQSTLPETEEDLQNIVIIPENPIEILAETIEIKTEKVMKTQTVGIIDIEENGIAIDISDKIRIKLEALEIQEAEARERKKNRNGGNR